MLESLFRVLVFDDEKDAHERASEELHETFEHIHLEHAYTELEARSLVEDQFFHLIFVDLFEGTRNVGIELIRHLTASNVGAPIVIVTAWRKESSNEVIDLFGSGANIIGFGNKLGADAPWYSSFAVTPYKDWAARRVDCRGLEGPDGIVAAILEKRERINSVLERDPKGRVLLAPNADAITDELIELSSKIFGVTAIPGRAAPVVELRVLRKGYSSSVVVEATPSIPVEGIVEPVAGNRCILKFGPVCSAEGEADRYDRVVRFGVALDYRVELLGWAGAKALGVVCYSFAESRLNDNLESLDSLLIGANGAWKRVLTSIFQPSTTSWYSVRNASKSLENFFRREYDADLRACACAMEQWIKELRANVPALDDRDWEESIAQKRRYWTVRLGRVGLTVPREQFLIDSAIQKATFGCLVHGDLHAGNILVDSSVDPPSFRIIDYGNAGLGPRFIDFAALQLSVRLESVAKLPVDSPLDESAIMTIVQEFYDDEQALAQGEQTSQAGWVQVSKVLANLARANFDDADDRERAWTELAFALAMFRFHDFEARRRVRILVWISALVDYLRGVRS